MTYSNIGLSFPSKAPTNLYRQELRIYIVKNQGSNKFMPSSEVTFSKKEQMLSCLE